jgi:Skp family chaperone for outer membrane proteins
MNRIAVVSVMKVLQSCQAASEQPKKMMEEQAKYNAELQLLAQELETENGQIQTLRIGTEDYLQQYKIIVDKQAKLKALEEYYRQVMTAKEKQWSEDLYKKILEATRKVADDKGFDIVLERTEPEFPIAPERFFVTISTHKVLYGKGCVDLTADVLAQVMKP